METPMEYDLCMQRLNEMHESSTGYVKRHQEGDLSNPKIKTAMNYSDRIFQAIQTLSRLNDGISGGEKVLKQAAWFEKQGCKARESAEKRGKRYDEGFFDDVMKARMRKSCWYFRFSILIETMAKSVDKR